MDPVSLVVGAVIAGAAAGVGDGTAAAVREAYGELVRRLRLRFRSSDRPAAEAVLDRRDADPEVWRAALADAVAVTGAGDDPVVLAAAQRVLAVVSPPPGAPGHVVDARGAQGVQVGDQSTQVNSFGAPPAAETAEPGGPGDPPR